MEKYLHDKLYPLYKNYNETIKPLIGAIEVYYKVHLLGHGKALDVEILEVLAVSDFGGNIRIYIDACSASL